MQFFGLTHKSINYCPCECQALKVSHFSPFSNFSRKQILGGGPTKSSVLPVAAASLAPSRKAVICLWCSQPVCSWLHCCPRECLLGALQRSVSYFRLEHFCCDGVWYLNRAVGTCWLTRQRGKPGDVRAEPHRALGSTSAAGMPVSNESASWVCLEEGLF